MKIFSLVKVSFTELNKSVKIDEFFFTKMKIFDKQSIVELVEFLKEKAPTIDNGQFQPINNFDHLFNNDRDKSRKFLFILSCLSNKAGHPIFQIVDMSSLVGIKSTGNNKLSDISELQVKPKVDDSKLDDKTKKDVKVDEDDKTKKDSKSKKKSDGDEENKKSKKD